MNIFHIYSVLKSLYWFSTRQVLHNVSILDNNKQTRIRIESFSKVV